MNKSVLRGKNELLQKKFINNISFVDLNFKYIHGGDISLYKGDALENAVLLWLTSGPYDYYDNPGKGGPLDKISVGTLMSPESITGFENRFIAEFDEVFGDKFTLVQVSLKPDLKHKKFKLYIIVFDILSKAYSEFNINLREDS